MKITKYGHCCLLIEENGLRILTDPGIFTAAQNEVKDVDILLITHEHSDHYHFDSVRAILSNNPKIKVLTNPGVGKLLGEAGIPYERIEHGEFQTFGGVLFEGFGKKHADIYPTVPEVENTGFFINRLLWYPGDAFHDPGRRPEFLALPVAGPWMKISEAIDYGKALRPKLVFPVHDGFLASPGAFHRLPQEALEAAGSKFIVPQPNIPTELA
jgi:L-ascorbate metabolism protein UlaG (beta-lactamase superfamily)